MHWIVYISREGQHSSAFGHPDCKMNSRRLCSITLIESHVHGIKLASCFGASTSSDVVPDKIFKRTCLCRAAQCFGADTLQLVAGADREAAEAGSQDPALREQAAQPQAGD